MGKLDGKVALITGGARGQGRTHALTLAQEGASIVVCDIARQIKSVPFSMGTKDELNETVRLVQELGRPCIGVKADVRNGDQMRSLVDEAIAKFGRIDILIANAGCSSFSYIADMTDEQWDDVIDTDLKGVFNCMRAVVPHMVRQNSGRIIAISSMAGRVGMATIGHYVAAKWGVIGLVKTLALEVAKNGITVNAVCPTTVNTPMINNEYSYRLFRPDVENPTQEDAIEGFLRTNPQPTPWAEPEDVAKAVLFLVSDSGRYITGAQLGVSAGWAANNTI